MKALVLTLIMVSYSSFASTQVLLTLKREKPSMNCEISKDLVKITRSIHGIKFTKHVSYQMDDISPMIQKAFESRNLSPTFESEHLAYFLGDSDVTRNTIGFFLDASEPNALKLINLISTFCEVRNY